MKKIIFAALAAMTLFACSNEDKEGASEGTNLKSLEFTLGVATPKTRMSDETVTNGAAAAVRANVKDITLEYFNSAGASLGTYNFSEADIIKVKADDQDGTRSPVTIKDIPGSTAKVNVYLNVSSYTNINDMQLTYKEMEYKGVPTAIALKTAAGGETGNDLYSVEVEVKPVLSRFEFKGDASTLTVNKDGAGTLPSGITGTRDQVKEKVSEAIILAAEKAAREAWKAANPGVAEPTTWSYTNYTISYKYDPAYTIQSIDGYYMNYIPVTAGGGLVQNANDATGNWDAASLTSYSANGSMKKMFDTSAPATGKNIAYNLFPQVSTPADNPTVAQVKATMPHFILKLTAEDDDAKTTSTRWLTIRALRTTDAANALVTSFEAGKVYVLDAADIHINQYSALLKVTANGTTGPDIPDPVDPTDPNPEPVGKDLEVLVKIANWTVVNVKPEW